MESSSKDGGIKQLRLEDNGGAVMKLAECESNESEELVEFV